MWSLFEKTHIVLGAHFSYLSRRFTGRVVFYCKDNPVSHSLVFLNHMFKLDMLATMTVTIFCVLWSYESAQLTQLAFIIAIFKPYSTSRWASLSLYLVIVAHESLPMPDGKHNAHSRVEYPYLPFFRPFNSHSVPSRRYIHRIWLREFTAHYRNILITALRLSHPCGIPGTRSGQLPRDCAWLHEQPSTHPCPQA